MTASFPTSIKSFTAVTDGVDYPEAVDINSLQEEVVAIETYLNGGFMRKDIASIANNSNATITTLANLSGLMIVIYNGSAGFRRTGLFIIEAYGLGSVSVVSDPATVYSATFGTANKANVYYDGANGVGLENKTGETINNITAIFLGRQT